MKYIFIASAVLALSCTKNKPVTEKPEVIMEQQKSVDPIYQFKVKDITGGEFNLADLKGKKSVNCKYCIQMRIDPTV